MKVLTVLLKAIDNEVLTVFNLTHVVKTYTVVL